jgi:hypothetical protein
MFNAIKRIQNGAMDAAAELAKSKVDEQQEKAQKNKLNRQRMKAGIAFVDDPERERQRLPIF